jgi:hypothetical protein
MHILFCRNSNNSSSIKNQVNDHDRSYQDKSDRTDEFHGFSEISQIMWVFFCAKNEGQEKSLL